MVTPPLLKKRGWMFMAVLPLIRKGGRVMATSTPLFWKWDGDDNDHSPPLLKQGRVEGMVTFVGCG